MIPSDINPWLFIGYWIVVTLMGVILGWTLRQIVIVRPLNRRRCPWWRNL